MRAGHSRATTAVALGVLAISSAAILFRAAAPTHPLVEAAVRLSVAAALLAPMVMRGWLAKKLPGPVLRAAVLCGLLYGVHFGAWVNSLAMTSVAASVTIVTATPLLLAVVAIVTGRDRPDRRHYVAIALALLGVGLIGGHDLSAPGALAGDALALLGAVAMALYLLIARSQGTRLEVWSFSGVACAVGALALFAAALVAGVPIAVSSTRAFGYLVLAALVPQVVGHGMLTWALRELRPTVVGMATVGEPALATLMAWWLLSEVPAGLVLVGCAITLGAVMLAVWEPRQASATR